jgi:hypothetical protein
VVEYRARMVDRCPLLVAAFANLDQSGAVAMSPDEWIMDRDLGPYNVVEVRLGAADTVYFPGLSIVRCARRAVRRSRERFDF